MITTVLKIRVEKKHKWCALKGEQKNKQQFCKSEQKNTSYKHMT